MLNVCANGVFCDKVGDDKSRVLGSIRCPTRCDMLMGKSLRSSYVSGISVVVSLASLLVDQRIFSSHKYVIHSSRKVDAIECLQTHCWWHCVDMLHWYMFLRPIFDVCVFLQLSQQKHELSIVKPFVQRIVVLCIQLEGWYFLER